MPSGPGRQCSLRPAGPQQELSAWDTWRLATKDDEVLTGAERALCDRIAALTQGDDVDLAEIRAIYDTVQDVRLRRGSARRGGFA